MRFRVSTALAALFIALVVLFIPCQAFDPLDPSKPPGVPAVMPPPVGSAPSDLPPLDGPQAAGTVETIEVNYTLPTGWSIISFPVGRVEKASGFTNCLYFFRDGMYYSVDPVNSPHSIDTRFAYLAHVDKPLKVSITGPINNGMVRSGSLSQGWNLLGCPFSKPLPLNRFHAMYKNIVKTFAQAVSPALDEGDYWISSKGYVADTVESSVNLLSPDSSLVPMKGLWIYSWHSVKIVFSGRGGNVVSTPEIVSIIPQTVSAGSTIAIQGSGFDTDAGFVAIGTTPIPPESVLSWSDTEVLARIPPYAQSGNVTVYANRIPSNAVPITVTDSPQVTGNSTLMGKVEGGNQEPVSGVLLTLDNGLSTKSGKDGSYVIEDVPPGRHTVFISRSGYKTAQGQVNLEPGGTDSVLITLTPSAAGGDTAGVNNTPPSQSSSATPPADRKAAPTEPKPKKGYLNIVADAYDDGYHRWWVRKIDVVEWGNENFHWYKDWWSDCGDAWYEMDCDGARVGQTYIVRIEWLSKDGGNPLHNSWYRKVYSTNQTETFDSPF